MGEEATRKVDLNSKFWRTFLFILAGVLVFAGPTYFVYVLYNVLDVGYTVSVVSGFVLFVVGLALMLYLVKKGAIS